MATSNRNARRAAASIAKNGTASPGTKPELTVVQSNQPPMPGMTEYQQHAYDEGIKLGNAQIVQLQLAVKVAEWSHDAKAGKRKFAEADIPSAIDYLHRGKHVGAGRKPADYKPMGTKARETVTSTMKNWYWLGQQKEGLAQVAVIQQIALNIGGNTWRNGRTMLVAQRKAGAKFLSEDALKETLKKVDPTLKEQVAAWIKLDEGRLEAMEKLDATSEDRSDDVIKALKRHIAAMKTIEVSLA